MRILVLLKPSNKHGTKTAYTTFRKHLLSDGFTMVAPELYMRVIAQRKAVAKRRQRMSAHIPPTGQISMLVLTEKQWASMELLTGQPSYQEAHVGARCCVML